MTVPYRVCSAQCDIIMTPGFVLAILAMTLQISQSIIANTWQIFEFKFYTFMETIILNKSVLSVAIFGLNASS